MSARSLGRGVSPRRPKVGACQTLTVGAPRRCAPTSALLAVLTLVVLPLRAQSIILKDGATIPAKNPRRDGTVLMNTLAPAAPGAPSGEIGYPLANVARLDWPEPPEIRAANDLLAGGKTAEALTRIEPVVTLFAPLRDIAGNWWAAAALVKANALAASRREAEARTLLQAVADAPPLDPHATELARLRLVTAHPSPDQEEVAALRACEALIKTSGNREAVAEAWLLKGRAHLGRKEYEPALLAYLRLPTLYTEQARLLPGALLGSARAYAGMGDTERARRAFRELIADHPTAPESGAAKAELPALEKK